MSWGVLSERQKSILRFVEVFIQDHDYPPSIRDIQQGCAISSTSVVDSNLKRLEEYGLLRRDHGISRAIYLAAMPRPRVRYVPLLGHRLRAGMLKSEWDAIHARIGGQI